MAKSITIRDTKRDADSGELIICVGKSRELVFPDLKSMNDSFDEQTEREDLLVGILISWAKRQPNGTWRDAKGKTITLDLDAPDGVILKVT